MRAATSDGSQQSHKAHRRRHAGVKAERRKAISTNATTTTTTPGGPDGSAAGKRSRNNAPDPRAFAVSGKARASLMMRRKAELLEKKLHYPMLDDASRASAAIDAHADATLQLPLFSAAAAVPPPPPPPLMVVIMGPPGCGKSTLLRSLVREYTKQNVTDVRGPVTLVANKKRRITFIECMNDINCMIDLAKVADLALLVVNASCGFEMETFEFLNLLQVHGFPKILGVFTHFDKLKNDSGKLQARRRTLKKKFWQETVPGVKIFSMSGVLRTRYLQQETLLLARAIVNVKSRPLAWRQAHCYMVADKVEDITSASKVAMDPKTDRRVAITGFLRGGSAANARLNHLQAVHLSGVGDFTIGSSSNSITLLPDPCPLPSQNISGKNGTEPRKIKDSLRLKHVYAPYATISGVSYDRDAIYINVPGHFSNRENDPDETLCEGERMVLNLQKYKGGTVDEKLAATSLRLFDDSEPATFERHQLEQQNHTSHCNSDDENDELEDKEDDEDYSDDEKQEPESCGSDDDDDDECLDKSVREFLKKSGVTGSAIAGKKVSSAGAKRNSKFDDSFIYGNIDSNDDTLSSEDKNDDDDDDDDDPDALFKVVRPKPSVSQLSAKQGYTADDASNVAAATLDEAKLSEWADQEYLASIKKRFMLGNKEPEKEESVAEQGAEDLYGDFSEVANDEQGEIKEKATEEELLERKKVELKRRFDEKYDTKEDEEEAGKGQGNPDGETYYGLEKQRLQREFMQAQAAFATDQDKHKVIGYATGDYLRLELENVPCEFIKHFDPRVPVVLGTLLQQETVFSVAKIRIKKHRWYPSVLKSNDPIIFSMGWRRFQSLPVYSIEENGLQRHRMLKYTPKHMHCVAHSYMPSCPPNTGFLAFQKLSARTSTFRVAATGIVLACGSDYQVVKKLKLTGTPAKIHKNTAFIQNMFTSDLEAAKFEGAKIQTVSGIRGQIKKSIPDSNELTKKGSKGLVRASFEDKIVPSDIVVLKAWVPVSVKDFYNPVVSGLLNVSSRSEWQGMRLSNTVRHDELGGLFTVKGNRRQDSVYKSMEEVEMLRDRHLKDAKVRGTKFKVPKSIAVSLPFKSKPKSSNKAARSNSDLVIPVVAEPKERAMWSLMQQLRTITNEKERKRKESAAAARAERTRKLAAQEKKEQALARTRTKKFYQRLGAKGKKTY